MTRPKDLMRGFLTVILLLGFLGALAALFQWVVPEANEKLVTYMLGQLSGFVSACVLFYVGTSKSSSDKNDTIANALKEDRDHPRSNTGFPYTIKGDDQ